MTTVEPGQPDAQEQKLQRFLAWLKQNGVTAPSVEIRTVNGLRGVYATENVLQGEIVLHVPRQLIITTEVVRDTPLGRQLGGLGVPINVYGYFAAFFLQVERDGGFWKPYIDMLPTEFPGMPGFFGKAYMDRLNGCYIQKTIRDYKVMLHKEYNSVKLCLPGVSLRKYALLYTTALTRVYRLNILGVDTVGMVPMADMLNHTSPSPTLWTGKASDGFTIMALENLDAPHEILESYGVRCNSRWIMSHGFCMEDNPANLVEIDIPAIKPAHPFFPYAKGMGELRGRKQRIFLIPQSYAKDTVRHMFSYLRLACQEDMPAVRRVLGSVSDARMLPTVSLQNEIGVLTALANACRRALERYDTTLEQDEAELANPDLHWTLRFVVMIPRGEKRILKYYLDLCEIALDAFRSSSFRMARIVAEQAAEGKPYADYFRDVDDHLKEFSSLWHLSLLPARKKRSAARDQGKTERKRAHA